MADFQATIKAILDASEAEAKFNSLVSNMTSKPIQIKVDFQSNQLGQQLASLANQFSNQGANAGQSFANAFSSSLNKIDLRNGGIGNIQNMLMGAGFNKNSIHQVTNELDKLTLSISKISTTQKSNGNISMKITGTDQLGRAVQIVREFDKETGKVQNTTKTFSQSFQNMANGVSNAAGKVKQFNELQAKTFGNQMTTWAKNNSKAVAAYGDQLDDLQSRLKTAIANKDVDAVKQLRDEFRYIQSEAKATGNIGKTFSESFGSAFSTVGKFVASYMSIYRMINTLKNGIKTVADLDTALVDLQKTSTATPKQLNSFYKEANDIAKEYGTTTQQIIQGTADWSRLGYNLSDAKTMSKLSSQFAAISPGMSVEESTSSLVSTMKAFGIEADDVLDGVMSKVNKVGNSFALSNADVMTALKNSSSAMAVANNSLDETIALITAGTEIVQDASKVGNGLRTISMRIRGRRFMPPYMETYKLCASLNIA